MNLTRHAVRRNIATSVIVCALVVLGLYGLAQLPVNFLPDMTYPMVRVITRLNGKPAIKLNVLKQADANTVEVASAVAEKLRDLTPSLPGDVRLGMVENQADYVGAALAGVRNTALEAAALVILTVRGRLGCDPTSAARRGRY